MNSVPWNEIEGKPPLEPCLAGKKFQRSSVFSSVGGRLFKRASPYINVYDAVPIRPFSKSAQTSHTSHHLYSHSCSSNSSLHQTLSRNSLLLNQSNAAFLVNKNVEGRFSSEFNLFWDRVRHIYVATTSAKCFRRILIFREKRMLLWNPLMFTPKKLDQRKLSIMYVGRNGNRTSCIETENPRSQ